MKTQHIFVRQEYDKIDFGAYGSKNFRDSQALTFHEFSKLDRWSSRILGLSIESFNSEMYHSRASQAYKPYPAHHFISFDEYKDAIPHANLFETIRKRRSRRIYKSYNLTLQEFFYLCHYAYGISAKAAIKGVDHGHWYYRNVPSGGGLFPLEIYPVILTGECEAGIYHYRPDKNGVELLLKNNFYDTIRKIITAEPMVKLESACAVIFVSGLFERTMIKYGERGYRFILQETGFVAQNISLVCEALGLGSCMIGGYLDNAVNDFIGIDGLFETILNVIVIGKPE
ncbi:SagB/ThcOx family dehydrogenase [candidate division KSB1 bacterium]|nr:SagB/ThcOx family dehydrogenase [candidate division KSB1 bacterium]RQW01827.1 MAG: SagB/ThcOx family dehydrogenase [candidate division KSB1 bacterium]